MKQATNSTQALLGPVQRKTFGAALVQTLREHVPTLGELTAQALAQHLQKLIDQYFPPTERLRMGQVLWPAIDVNETAGYGKPIEQCRLKPVMLQAISEQDIAQLLAGARRPAVRQQIAVRLCLQAHEQGGVLTLADVGTMLHVSPTTASKYIKDYEQEHPGELVPRRGTIHDMGPTLTHKKIICRKVIHEGKSIEQTAQQTRHSPAAVTRYVQDYRRVAACLKQGMSLKQAAYATGLSPRLAADYQELIELHQSKQNGKKEVQ
jgi:predicted transcriptional regulator